MKKNLLYIGLFIGLLFLIPIIFSLTTNRNSLTSQAESSSSFEQEEFKAVNESTDVVTVFRVEDEVYEDLPLEQYIIGVVAAEMPAMYDEEALKAQAVAARSYALSVLESEESLYDSVKHQVYLDESQLQERWGDDFEMYYDKVASAVIETAGELLVYEGELIEPLYFAMSNGTTENAEDYWGKEVPYLMSVSSEWDKTAETFEESVQIDLTTFYDAFGVESVTSIVVEVLEKTEGGNISQILIGDRVFTGREVRETLGIRSTDFTFEFTSTHVIVTTYGYGHGVGMSQYGANELAKLGRTYDEILTYYYQDVEIINK